jgi:hypothetical protein
LPICLARLDKRSKDGLWRKAGAAFSKKSECAMKTPFKVLLALEAIS